MFADYFTLDLGGVKVKGRRMTIRELRESKADFLNGSFSDEKGVELIKSHVTLENGEAFDPLDLTPGQVRKIVAELILPEEGRGIADFIGLLS